MGVSDKEFQALLGAANPEGEVAPSTNKPAVSDEEFKSLLDTQGEAQPKETATTPKTVSDDEFASLLGTDPKPKVSDNEFNSLLGGKTSTVGQAVGIGAIEGLGTGITSNIYHALQATHPEAAEVVQEAASNITSAVSNTVKMLIGQDPENIKTLNGLYGDNFLSPATTDQQRRDMIISSTDQWKKSLVNDYYAGVDTSNHPYFNKTGQMLSGMVTDPTMLLAPEVNGASALVRIGQVSAFGARLGAAQGASDVLSTVGVPTTQEQSLDAAAHVVVSAVLGAAIGAGLHTAIGEPLLKLSGTLQAKKLSGELVTPEEVASSLGGAPKPLQGVDAAERLGALPEASEGLPLGKGIQDFDLPQVTQEHQKIADNLNETFGLGKGPEEARTDQLVESALGQTNKSEAQIQLEYLQAKGGDVESIPLVKDVSTKRPDPFANVQDFVLNDPYREELHQTLLAQPELTENILKSTGQDYSMAMSMGRSKEYLAIEAVKNGDILLNSEMGQRLHPIDNGLGLNQSSDPHGGNASAFQERPTNGGGGGELPPDEPPLGEGPFDRPDPLSDKIKTQYLDSKSMTFMESMSRTQQVWKKTGAPGYQAYDMWRNTQENIHMAQGKWMGQFYNIMDENNLLYGRSSLTNIRKAVNGMDDEEIVKGLLNKTHDGPVTKGQLRAAQQMRQMFDQHVGDWVQSGLMTPERGAEIIKNAKENGYFPRVADTPFLRTKEGQTKFREAMANVEYGNETTAKKVVEAIVGDKRLLRKRNAVEKIPDSGEIGSNGKVIKGTEKYRVVPEIYQYLWKKQTNVGDGQLSSHMEHNRVLPQELEKALQPFQVRGLEHAMKTYSFDTNTRLEYAKIWGPNNENFVELFNKMHDINPVAAENFNQSYWTQLGDPKAWNIQTLLAAPRWASNASAISRSLTVFKLTLAPIKNMVQNPIMSATHLAKTTYVPVLNRKGVINPYQAMMTFFKGNFKGLAGEVGIGEASDVARRFGASIEHAYASMTGKLSDNATIGKGLGYIPLVGDLLKDPGTWLKLNTFEKTEDIQRSQGMQVGIQYTYYLLQNLKKQEALLADGKIKPIKVERTRAALEEVGIPRSTTIDNVTIENMRNSSWLIAHANEVNTQMIGKAGQRLSNEFNFTNSVADRPLFANSFMGKLLSSLHRFSFGTSAFLVDNVWKPMVKDQNVLPFMMYFGVGTAAGMRVMDGYRWLAGDNKEKTLTKRVFDAFGAVASLGLPMDILSSTTYGKYAPLAAVAGPALTTPSTIAASFGQLYNQAAYQGKFDKTPLIREFLGDVSLPFNKQMKLDLSVKNRDIFNAKFEATQGQDVFGNQKIEKAPFEQ